MDEEADASSERQEHGCGSAGEAQFVIFIEPAIPEEAHQQGGKSGSEVWLNDSAESGGALCERALSARQGQNHDDQVGAAKGSISIWYGYWSSK